MPAELRHEIAVAHKCIASPYQHDDFPSRPLQFQDPIFEADCPADFDESRGWIQQQIDHMPMATQPRSLSRDGHGKGRRDWTTRGKHKAL
jgi:hypothetical protein